MKKILLSALMLGAMASSSFAIFQMDVSPDLLPEGETFAGADMYLFGNPTTFPNTGMAGPDGFPLMYHVLFDYDATVPGGAVDHVDLMAGECTNTWAPAMFTVFYTPGPAFPVNGVFDAFSGDCFGGGVVDANEGPVSFGLADAYPNPFNPTTTIDFSVDVTGEVSLNVFNINGQLVRTLVDGATDAGAHSVVFDAADLASGVYLYTLESASQSITKKMVLVK